MEFLWKYKTINLKVSSSKRWTLCFGLNMFKIKCFMVKLSLSLFLLQVSSTASSGKDKYSTYDSAATPSWGELLKEFSKDTTLHGVRYFAIESRFVIVRRWVIHISILNHVVFHSLLFKNHNNKCCVWSKYMWIRGHYTWTPRRHDVGEWEAGNLNLFSCKQYNDVIMGAMAS